VHGLTAMYTTNYNGDPLQSRCQVHINGHPAVAITTSKNVMQVVITVIVVQWARGGLVT